MKILGQIPKEELAALHTLLNAVMRTSLTKEYTKTGYDGDVSICFGCGSIYAAPWNGVCQQSGCFSNPMSKKD